MNYSGAIVQDMARLLDLFGPHCSERETLDWLRKAVDDRGKWTKAHGIHSAIRAKSLKAARAGNAALEAQYLFEEVCAKTLYNLCGAPTHFDVDSPYWPLPNAIVFARRIGIAEAEILGCVSLHRSDS